MSRLSPGTLVVAVIAILLAMTGAFTVRQFLERDAVDGNVKAEVAPITVPVAVTHLEPGRKLRESDFATLTLSPENFAKSKYSKVAFISEVEQLIGRVIREELVMGMTVGPEGLYPEGTGPTVADQLPAGMRAVTVKVSGSGFVDGFAAPGTVVDVLFRSSATDGEAIPETTITALHGIEILAVDTSPYPFSLPEPSPGGATTPREDVRVTFAVRPTQATMLKALEDRGEISLALRPNEATEQVVVGASDQESVPERHAQTLTTILEGAKAPLVAVTTTELMGGRIVRSGDLRLIEADQVDGDVGEHITYADIETLVGRVLRSEVTSGQAITADLLYPEGVTPGVADRLPRGFRAVTVNMSNDALVNGFVSPGTHVDVFFRAEALESYPETTLRVLEGLQVLAIEDRVSAGGGPDADQVAQGVRVTMAVPLAEVGRIQALEGHGTMTLAVRANDERSISEVARDLENSQAELGKIEKQIDAFEQIAKLDESISLSKEQRERLAALIDERPKLERQIQQLNDERDAATTGASQTTLAEVLNLPEPSRPTSLEIYNGGSRQTLVFNSNSRMAPAARTASRTPKTSNDVKSTSIKKPAKPAGSVKNATGAKPAANKVSLVSPGRKVSAIERKVSAIEPSRSSLDLVNGRRRRSGDSILTSFANFAENLVAGLNKATQAESRVQIFRGGIRE